MLVALLMRAGLGTRVAKFGSYVLIALALIAAAWWLRRDAYNDGQRDTNAEWQAASERLKREAAASASRADDAAALRVEEHVEQVQAEKEKLDEAQRTGSSPLDVLFGSGGLQGEDRRPD